MGVQDRSTMGSDASFSLRTFYSPPYNSDTSLDLILTKRRRSRDNERVPTAGTLTEIELELANFEF